MAPRSTGLLSDEETSRVEPRYAQERPQLLESVRAKLAGIAGLVLADSPRLAGLLVDVGDARGEALWLLTQSRTRPALYFSFGAAPPGVRAAVSEAVNMHADGALERVSNLCAIVRVTARTTNVPALLFDFFRAVLADLQTVKTRLLLEEAEVYDAAAHERARARALWDSLTPLRGFLRPCVSLQIEADAAVAELQRGWPLQTMARNDDVCEAEVCLLVLSTEPPADLSPDKPAEFAKYQKVVWLPRLEPPLRSEWVDKALGTWGAVVYGTQPLCACLRVAVDLMNERTLWHLDPPPRNDAQDYLYS